MGSEPFLLHVGIGAIVFALLAVSPSCGEDECARTLFLVVCAVVWLVAAALVLQLERAGRRFLVWLVPFAWVPLAWGSAILLFVLFPSLGSA